MNGEGCAGSIKLVFIAAANGDCCANRPVEEIRRRARINVKCLEDERFKFDMVT